MMVCFVFCRPADEDVLREWRLVDDLAEVIARAKAAGVEKIMVTGGSLEESKQALLMAREHDGLYSTVGCHPTRSSEWAKSPDPDRYYEDLLKLARDGMRDGKIVAIGECGLDYDRLHFSPANDQKTYFKRQFALAAETGLPFFLHDRNTGGDFSQMLKENRDYWKTGVVHSFTGSIAELEQYLEMGLYIGINGCSMKTEDNIEALKKIPLDRLMIETDAPWCDIRPTHASASYVSQPPEDLVPEHANENYPFPHYFFDKANVVKQAERLKIGQMFKGRNEPCTIIKVLSATAAIREEPIDVVADAAFENTAKVFFSRA